MYNLRSKLLYLLLLVFIFSLSCNNIKDDQEIQGQLFIIGGGHRGPEIMNELVASAGGQEARVLIIPNATSYREEVVEEYMQEFRSLGVSQVKALDFDSLSVDRPENLRAVQEADCIYFVGGDQSRITRDMLGSALHEAVLQRYKDGAVIAGTSAGAAVQSQIMLTGNEYLNAPEETPYNSIRRGNIETVPGLAFLQETVIDQHFIRRKRLTRLISVVLENPELYGIGIDESTAIIVDRDQKFRVIGKHQVMIIDATGSSDISSGENNDLSASGVQLHLLRAGQGFDLKNGKVLP